MNSNPFYRFSGTPAHDPFGRLPEPSHEPQLDVSNPFDLTASVGERRTNQHTDVGKIEALLRLAGVLDMDATGGPTGYFGSRLGEAVKGFQKSHNLRVDGDITPDGETLKTLAQTLQGMGRKGDTVLAHLTADEARFLHRITDGGSINPQTGLMEFWDAESEAEAGYDAGAANDAQAAENGAQDGASASSGNGDPAGYGDMTPVDAVNQARAEAEARANAVAAARDQAARQRAVDEARIREAKQKQQRQQRQERQRAHAMPTGKPKGAVNLLEQNDNDRQSGRGAGRASDDQSRENDAQHNATHSKSDPAGYGDMTSVNAVNNENPYAGDIAAMQKQMDKNNKRPSIPQQVRAIEIQIEEKYKGKKSPPNPSTPKQGPSLMDQLIDSLDEYMKDPNKGPTETPPNDPPPPSGPPPAPNGAKTPAKQGLELSAGAVFTLAALFVLSLVGNR
ncbi:MAG: peptidoglycan-binding protein [Rhodospirillaceae bacterium]|nr:peptidoglycan-binding protein [Rhodospirillaceae bacterium]